MHDGDIWDIERLLADTRAAISRSRAHIARLRRDLSATRTAADAMRRDLTALWHRLAEVEHHGSQPDLKLSDSAADDERGLRV